MDIEIENIDKGIRELTPEEKRRIVDFYLHNEQNEIKAIAESFDITIWQVHRVINNFFAENWRPHEDEHFIVMPSKMNF